MFGGGDTDRGTDYINQANVNAELQKMLKKLSTMAAIVGLSFSVNAYADTEIYGGASIGTSYYADYTGSLASIVATEVALSCLRFFWTRIWG